MSNHKNSFYTKNKPFQEGNSGDQWAGHSKNSSNVKKNLDPSNNNHWIGEGSRAK